jgi:cell wall-associated NlpC family hydrolase
MLDSNSQRPALSARRKRLSAAYRINTEATARLRANLGRVGLHGLMVAVGLTAAVTVWNGASEPVRVAQVPSSESIAASNASADEADQTETMAETETSSAATVAQATGSQPQSFVRHVTEGDTIRSLASEYSVSMSTILASNKFDNPDLIQVGQEIIIPPVDGVVAEVKSGETLAQVAERYSVTVEDVAQANALAADPASTIPFERIIVPGKETAERAIGVARRDTSAVASGEAAGNTIGSVDASQASRPDILTYEVQDGDTVGQLATQFGVSVWTILSANNLADADLIRPGTRLKVLPVNGIEHEVLAGESLADIASFYKVDLGPLIDFNALADPDNLRVGNRITIPGAERPQPGFSVAGSNGSGGTPAALIAAAPVTVPAPAARAATTNVAAAQKPAVQTTLAQAKPAAPVVAAKPAAPVTAAAKPQTTVAQAKPAAPVAAAKPAASTAAAAPTGGNRLTAAAVSAPAPIVSGAGGSSVVAAAMRHLGARYVFGGTSPAGFDCSGFVWYVHKALGRPVSRGLWGQLNGGPRIALNALQPGDTVFFANTYMPGLSHAGIYIGGGRFIHASDESSGVKISSLSDAYWGPRYIGASRLY